MTYYKTPENEIYAFDKGQADLAARKITELGLIEVTEAEAAAIANPPPSAERMTQAAIAQLLAKLGATDYKAVKAAEKGRALEETDPEMARQRQSWRDEINALRGETQ
jgi:hypothetical protein